MNAALRPEGLPDSCPMCGGGKWTATADKTGWRCDGAAHGPGSTPDRGDWLDWRLWEGLGRFPLVGERCDPDLEQAPLDVDGG